jgi:hypothetical protein
MSFVGLSMKFTGIDGLKVKTWTLLFRVTSCLGGYTSDLTTNPSRKKSRQSYYEKRWVRELHMISYLLGRSVQ